MESTIAATPIASHLIFAADSSKVGGEGASERSVKKVQSELDDWVSAAGYLCELASLAQPS